MTTLNEMFPSRYLNSGDVADGDLTLTIKAVRPEQVGSAGNSQTRHVARFHETSKGLVINKTHATALAKQFGGDSDYWIGQKVTLGQSETNFGGDQVACIRIRSKAPAPATRTAQGAPARAAAAPQEGDSDSIPF